MHDRCGRNGEAGTPVNVWPGAVNLLNVAPGKLSAMAGQRGERHGGVIWGLQFVHDVRATKEGVGVDQSSAHIRSSTRWPIYF